MTVTGCKLDHEPVSGRHPKGGIIMSAKVRPSAVSGWAAICKDCDEIRTGTMAQVDLWADVHNDDNHREAGK